MIEKTYEPAAVEDRIYRQWVEAGAFAAGAGSEPGAETFSIVIPPPNVTGSLHIGHALNNTIQDILVRFERMRGKDVLWQPGTDHAGIATQMIVERRLAEAQQPGRRDLGRPEFLRRVWEWKAESGGTIMNQLRRLGASADFSRERFTMGETGGQDDQMVRAVTKVFVELYRKGLIYRAKRLVNWHPGLETAISDLEVENIETKGKMWHLRYPLAAGVTFRFPVAQDEDGNATEWEERDYIVVATTRPETMLGDTGVAVHPEDERYRDLVGKSVVLPLTGRRVPIVADDYADPALGSGAVKITPAHDFNDFEVGQRAGLAAINILTASGRIAEAEGVPAWLVGLDRFEARTAILAELEESGVLDHVEDKAIMVPFDEKSKLVVIEPYLTDQWFVNAEEMARPALASVREGRTRFVPENWQNTYFAWMENIKPWCISRQLWWGHQIPAWYGFGSRQVLQAQEIASSNPTGRTFSSPDAFSGLDFPVFVMPRIDASEPALAAELNQIASATNLGNWTVIEVKDAIEGSRLLTQSLIDGKPKYPVWRDPDVLDTWFSSALWPFSTLGWPDETPELAKYYPTDVLVTGFDIIFFWVARMMMMGLEFNGSEPFHTVYVHALVRDEKGQKMSKTKGNVIDPLKLIEGYGADATRFTLAAMAAQGRDLKLAMSRVEGYRNFVTKLWNAARFLEMNDCRRAEGFDPKALRVPVNRWIVGATHRAVLAVTRHIEDYRFNDAANAAYDFVWGSFCDWYVELAKPILAGEDEAAKAETRATASFALDQILKLLHPFMPFVTEELWAETGKHGPARESLLILSRWPDLAGLEDAAADADIGWLIELVSTIRSVRTEMNVPAGAKLPLVVVGAGEATMQRLVETTSLVSRLARLEAITPAVELPAESAQFVIGEAIWALPLGGVIDLVVERARLEKEIGKCDAEIAQVDKKLGNAQFVAKAPEEVIEEQRSRREAAEDRRAKLRAALARLG